MPRSQNLCEYYFDSRVERVSGDEQKIKNPQVYFERDLTTKELPYRLFVVLDEWLPGSENSDAYDTVRIWYEQGKTDCAEIRAQDDYKQIYAMRQKTDHGNDREHDVRAEGNVLVIKKAINLHPAGAGCIEMYKKTQCVAKFYFAVNFAYRRKIFYTVDIILKKTVTLKFRCKTTPDDGIVVRLLGHETRLPCLSSDREDCMIGDPIRLRFQLGVATVTVPLPENIVEAGENARLFVVLEREYENMFVLVTDVNETLPAPAKPAYLKPSYSCPFCHEPIETSLALTRAYRSQGGVSCDARVKNGNAEAQAIRDENNVVKKRCMICRKDVSPVDDRQAKIFPDGFLEHENFKIAFQGGPRAGKTTYISRFFGLKSTLLDGGKRKSEDDRLPGDYLYRPSMQDMKYVLDRFGIVADAAKLMSIDAGRKRCDGKRWEEKEMQYINRGMEMGRKLPSTPHGDYTEYPFMLEVNSRHYISFYDIAGEDAAQNNKYIRRIAENDDKTIGIFFIVTATSSNVSVNQMVAEQLKSAIGAIDLNCPVAVILSKMDAIGDQFDSSCACRRFDYYPSKFMSRDFVYDGSDLEKFIDVSSEEIKSFIESGSDGVDIEQKKKNDSNGKRFQNVKYFCISSFGFPESTCHDSGNIDDESYMKFATSSRRMELPFIWMMRQFGIIA